MKRHTTLPFLLLIILACTACDDFLDREPLDQITVDNFYQNVGEAEQAVIGAYTPMMDVEWNGKGWQMTEIPSDNSMPGGTDPDFTPIDNFAVTADNPPVANYWAIHFRQVALANSFIAKIQKSPIEETAKPALIAEARFLRAVAYFDLVRLYGGVPLITEPTVFGADLLPERAAVSEVYDLIIADFTEVADLLPLERQGAAVGRATRGAALAFLAKVYLTTRDYLQARNAAKAVMDLNIYQLMPNFQDNFDLSTSDNNAESVFQIQFTGCGPFGTGNALQAFFAPWGEGITRNRDGWGSQIPTGPAVTNPNTTALDMWEEGDLRKQWTVMTAGQHYPSINPSDGGYTYPATGASASQGNIKKYVVGAGSNICFMSTPQNSHLIRYSDVLLTYAEAIMEIQGSETTDPEALEPFNAVRQRAGLPPVDRIDREVVLQERRVEFSFEGQRWFDLLRTTDVVDRMLLHGRPMQDHHRLFPIPAGEREINPNLTQNPGY